MAAVSSSAKQSLYPELVENLFPEAADDAASPPPTTEETLVAVSGAQLHLVNLDRSLDLGASTLSVIRLRQGGHSITILARLILKKRSQRRGLFNFWSSEKSSNGDPVQWPLTRDVTAVKLNTTHYFFSLHVPHMDHADDKDDTKEAEAEKDTNREAALSYFRHPSRPRQFTTSALQFSTSGQGSGGV
ncbi:hypothetical protein E2562_035334 [Oryza meyeriana var. granulata]|uniref:Uncharacterized protein n=1 Tax=Oryza meyeriana var. granulata TaxID=110450 RepID=A0A6G1DS53_9ORYZ|nr:hypothetical protein E2562_035334 [Oryza meyeriana var. granulata]